MKRRMMLATLVAALPLLGWFQLAHATEETPVSAVPKASAFTPAPLRNRLRVELNAAAANIWTLVGDLRRFPEYSSGLALVDTKKDSAGELTEYVCHFKPMQEGGESISHREFFRWHQAPLGWATMAEEPNAFGLKNSLTLVSLTPIVSGTVVTFEQYYNGTDLSMLRAEFDRALADIGENLVRKFGGKVVERTTDAPL